MGLFYGTQAIAFRSEMALEFSAYLSENIFIRNEEGNKCIDFNERGQISIERVCAKDEIMCKQILDTFITDNVQYYLRKSAKQE